MTPQETSQNLDAQTQTQTQKTDQNSTSKESPKNRLDHFMSLLDEKDTDNIDDNDENDESTTDENDSSTEDAKEVTLESLDDLAKQLKVDKAKLYGVKIKLKDDAGEVTLGELKDAYQEGREIDLERIDWGKEKVAQEQELVTARKEIEVLASLLPKDSLNKESLEAARKVVKAQLDRQRNDLLKRVPEWNDEEFRKSDITKINDHLKGYGLSFSDISDSRIAHYIRNSWLREERIERALEKVRPKKKTSTTPSKGNQGQNRKSTGRKISPRARNIARNLLSQMDD